MPSPTDLPTLDQPTLTRRLETILAEHPGVILEVVARKHDATYRQVLEALPPGMQTQVPGAHFAAAVTDLTEWGDVVFIVHTEDAIIEVKGPLPAGDFGHGFYNLHAERGLSGHLRAEHCAAIAFVRRPFMGKDSASVQFLNQAGAAMFKVFVGRTADGALQPTQLERFEQLRARLLGAEAA
jgi:heme iron utilization protein